MGSYLSLEVKRPVCGLFSQGSVSGPSLGLSYLIFLILVPASRRANKNNPSATRGESYFVPFFNSVSQCSLFSSILFVFFVLFFNYVSRFSFFSSITLLLIHWWKFYYSIILFLFFTIIFTAGYSCAAVLWKEWELRRPSGFFSPCQIRVSVSVPLLIRYISWPLWIFYVFQT